MDMTQMEQLATEVAYELGLLRGEGWVLHRMGKPDDTWPSAYLAGEDGALLLLQYADVPAARVTATGLFPDGTTMFGVHRASVNPDRGTAVLAREVDRRVLQAGYLEMLPSALAQHRRREAAVRHRAELLGQVAALFGVDASDYGDGRKVFLGEVTSCSGYVENSLGAPESLSLNLSGIPAATALEMLAVLARATREEKLSTAKQAVAH